MNSFDINSEIDTIVERLTQKLVDDIKLKVKKAVVKHEKQLLKQQVAAHRPASKHEKTVRISTRRPSTNTMRSETKPNTRTGRQVHTYCNDYDSDESNKF